VDGELAKRVHSPWEELDDASPDFLLGMAAALDARAANRRMAIEERRKAAKNARRLRQLGFRNMRRGRPQLQRCRPRPAAAARRVSRAPGRRPLRRTRSRSPGPSGDDPHPHLAARAAA
jgi:hypothetical protein